MSRRLRELLIAGVLLFTAGCTGPQPAPHAVESVSNSDQELASAFESHRTGFQITGEGEVSRILPDDNEGARHQRFIIRLRNGHTLLIVHNIDVAPRIKNLQVSDIIGFSGEYEWNAQGGVIHWTHHDPAGRHIAGWIQYKGQRYQ
jgi:hypothetical protein